MKSLEILMDKIAIDPKTKCWVWQRSTREGYGQITIDGFPWTTHRYAYTATNGDIPDGMLVRHKCHNRLCCNPEHLLLGTSLDNWEDSKQVYQEIHLSLTNTVEIGEGSFPNIYPGYRAARRMTGLPMGTLVKYTKDGVFDIQAYRSSCAKKGITPKV